MEARFHLKWWQMTGVWPRGAQVRRVTGSSEAPDSSQNTMAARRLRALARILGPVLGHPAGDRPLVTLDGAAGGAQQPVVEPVAQQLPDVAAMVADRGELFDHGRHTGQGPVIGVEAVRAGTLAQRLVDGGELLVVKARGVPGGAGAAQRLLPALAPVGCQKSIGCHAARWYSWMRPPRTSRRWSCRAAADGSACSQHSEGSGADKSRPRWGRWRL